MHKLLILEQPYEGEEIISILYWKNWGKEGFKQLAQGYRASELQN